MLLVMSLFGSIVSIGDMCINVILQLLHVQLIAILFDHLSKVLLILFW